MLINCIKTDSNAVLPSKAHDSDIDGLLLLRNTNL